MKNLILTSTVLVVVCSCSSVNKTGHERTDAVLEHMSQEVRIIGKGWEERFTKDGFIEGEYVAIGSSMSESLNESPASLKVNAEARAVGNLLKSAPSDFKKVILHTLNTTDGTNGSTSEEQVMLTEVKGLTGLKSKFSDFQCIKRAKPNKELKWDFEKECRVIVRVPAKKLLETYDFTLKGKYGVQSEKRFKDELRKKFGDRNLASEL